MTNTWRTIIIWNTVAFACLWIGAAWAQSNQAQDKQPVAEKKQEAKPQQNDKAKPAALGDLKNVISSGSTSGGEARTIPGSGGARQPERAAAKERSKEAPAGSLAAGGKEAKQSAEEAVRGKTVDAAELAKTRQTRTVEGLTKAADPQSGLSGIPGGKEGTSPIDKSRANPLDTAPKAAVSASDGKNESGKREQQSDTPAAMSPGSMVYRASKDPDYPRDREMQGTVQELINDVNAGPVERFQRDSFKAREESIRRIGSWPVGVRGTPTPDQTGGDGGPVPGAVGLVDRAPKSIGETKADLKRQVTLPGEDGTGSTERVNVNPGEASKAVMGARQQNAINPSREDGTITAGPATGGIFGGKPVPTNSGGGNFSGKTGGGGEGSGQPCPTCVAN